MTVLSNCLAVDLYHPYHYQSTWQLMSPLTNSNNNNKRPLTNSNNNNNRRLVTLAEHTSDHGRQTNSSTEEKGEQV